MFSCNLVFAKFLWSRKNGRIQSFKLSDALNYA